MKVRGGDDVTVSGFEPGVSATRRVVSEEVERARGATLQFERNGSWAGVDGSVMLAGMSVAELQSRSASIVDTGRDGVSYIYMHFNSGSGRQSREIARGGWRPCALLRAIGSLGGFSPTPSWTPSC